MMIEATMQLLLIRHAIAEDREEFAASGRNDGERPLTKHGKRQMRRVAKGLRRTVKSIDVLGASPLVRAQQTAAIVAEAYGEIAVATVPSLAPESEPEAFADWLGRQRIAESVAAVGHDPHLGMLVTWLLAGRMEPRVDIEKGGAVLLDVKGAPRAGCATLLWALTPAMLVRLGD
ncbi:MAG TPA: phosphohistidine phosphatase SixA [Gemmatimonadaceae bacterium]